MSVAAPMIATARASSASFFSIVKGTFCWPYLMVRMIGTIIQPRRQLGGLAHQGRRYCRIIRNSRHVQQRHGLPHEIVPADPLPATRRNPTGGTIHGSHNRSREKYKSAPCCSGV